jgi:hypothetical protein
MIAQVRLNVSRKELGPARRVEKGFWESFLTKIDNLHKTAALYCSCSAKRIKVQQQI